MGFSRGLSKLRKSSKGWVRPRPVVGIKRLMMVMIMTLRMHDHLVKTLWVLL